MKARRTSVFLVWIALAVMPAAQEDAASDAQQKEALRRLEEHDRVELHPAEDPLVVVGREQGDNDLRSRTPALMRVEDGVDRVDSEELYARAIALYEGRVFHAPARVEKPTRVRERSGLRPSSEPRGFTDATQEEGSGWGTRAFFGGLLIALGFLLRRVLRASSGPG